MRRRFLELMKVIMQTVDINDAFGLRLGVFQMNPAYPNAFAFPTSAQKVAAFMRWLEEQVRLGMLDVRELEQVGESINAAWTNKYIFDSYKRGVIRARMEMRRAGFEVPSIDDTGGILMSMGTPFHLDRLGLLYTRVFTDLLGITKAMDTIISRILSQGIADGDNPRLLARKLVSTISGRGIGDLGITDALGRFIPPARRAEILARTEIIRAHHQAMIQEYRNWGITGVRVMAEWKTAGDDRVCSLCEPMEGRIFTLEEVQPMIPLHPQCRCIALPYKKEYEQL
jgi:SPP1 gp7 family putative phage head morphogenesis protein